MKKLNNKGMTSIEILITFVLVVIIIISMYNTVLSYRSKQQLESYKQTIMTYKNLLTKEIQDDLIKKELVSVNITHPDKSKSTEEEKYTTTITMGLKDGTYTVLKIKQKMAYDIDDEKAAENSSKDVDDEFLISYGESSNITNYPLPNLGSTKNANGKTVYDFRINNLDINNNDNILTIYIGFYHPNLEKKYAINIVCPINYQ